MSTVSLEPIELWHLCSLTCDKIRIETSRVDHNLRPLVLLCTTLDRNLSLVQAETPHSDGEDDTYDQDVTQADLHLHDISEEDEDSSSDPKEDSDSSTSDPDPDDLDEWDDVPVTLPITDGIDPSLPRIHSSITDFKSAHASTQHCEVAIADAYGTRETDSGLVQGWDIKQPDDMAGAQGKGGVMYL